jgi:uncharacterized protein (DUF1800 family)
MNLKISMSPEQAWKPVPDSFRLTRPLAAHLYRRAGFGASSKMLDRAVAAGLQTTIHELFNQADDSIIEQQLQGIERLAVTSNQVRLLSDWWVMRMLRSKCTLLEKTTFFWHGHFATSAAKVTFPNAMVLQNRLLRKHALGKFESLVKGISRDVAMLIYLDCTQNRKTRPNENYARELMELFCLGLDKYTEADIKEVARCFTGWEVRRREFNFNQYQHDDGNKSFLGQAGTYDGDDAIDIILSQPSCARFIAWKLIRYFMVDEIEADSAMVTPLANHLRKHDFDIASSIRLILDSQWFYSEDVIGHKIKSPVEMALGVMNCLETSDNINEINNDLAEIGQLPFYPPNVKGWDGGRKWINASSLLGRANLVRRIANSDATNNSRGDLAAWAQRHGKRDPEQIIDWLLEMLVAVEVPDAVKSELIETIKKSNGSQSKKIADTLALIGTLPEFQLN